MVGEGADEHSLKTCHFKFLLLELPGMIKKLKVFLSSKFEDQASNVEWLLPSVSLFPLKWALLC